MPNWGGGLKGAASGAATGAAFGPIGAGIGGLIGGVAGLFGGGESEADKAYREQAEANNKYTAGRDAANKNIYDMITGGGANPSAFLNPTTTTTGSNTGTTSQRGTTRTSGMSSSLPIFTPEGMSAYQSMLEAANAMPTQLSAAQRAMLLNRARQSGDAARQAGENALAAHGGGAPGMTGALAQQNAIETGNAMNNAIAGFDTTNAQLAAAKAGVEGQAASLGRGQQTQSDTTSVMSSLLNMLGGNTSQRVGSALEGIPYLQALLSPTAPIQTTNPGTGPSVLGGATSLVGALAPLFKKGGMGGMGGSGGGGVFDSSGNYMGE